MLGTGVHSPEDRRFVGLAEGVLDDILVRDPAHATRIGDHRFDERMPDLTPDGADEFARVLQRHQLFLDRVDERALSRFALADLQILRRGVARRIFDLTVLRRNEWDPLAWSPIDPLYTLVARPYAPPKVRARSLIHRLRTVPEFLDSARQTLGPMPRPHVITAVTQLRQLGSLLTGSLGELASEPGVQDAVETAVRSCESHADWLWDQVDEAQRPAALGPDLYRGVMRHHLDLDCDIDELLAAAEDDLDCVLDDLVTTAVQFGGTTVADRSAISQAVEQLAAESDVSDANVLEVADDALIHATDFVTENRILSVPDIDLRLEAMPAARRGVAVAYCDAPGPLERSRLATLLAIAPTPRDWDRSRRQTFYREYNRHMIQDLMVHEAMPGHAVQLARAREAAAPTYARATMPSELFIEGWAVYAEEMMVREGFTVADEPRPSLRLQQLKMRLRTILNTILDIRIHTRGMTEAEARRLLSTKGFQEDGEIVGKWHRAQLTAGQLPSYYVGHRGVSNVVADLAARHRDWSLGTVHDAVLSHGSVPPAVLRGLVGLE